MPSASAIERTMSMKKLPPNLRISSHFMSGCPKNGRSVQPSWDPTTPYQRNGYNLALAGDPTDE